MNWEAWLVAVAIVLMFVALVRNWGPTDAVLVIVVTILALVGELSASPNLPRATKIVEGIDSTLFGYGWSKYIYVRS